VTHKSISRMIRPSLCAALMLAPLAAAADAPSWLKELARQPAKTYANDVDGVVLLDEQEVTVSDNGEIVTHGRLAYRILRPGGRERYSLLFRNFDGEVKIRSMHGWSITAAGREYEAKDKDAVETSASTFEVFSDEKIRVLHVPGGDVGSVVGFEYEERNRPYIFWDEWDFQRAEPVERSRYVLHVPARWEFRARWVNHGDQPPVSQGGGYSWELTDIPRIEREYNRPPQRALAGRMIVTFFSDKSGQQSFKDWGELAAWHAQLIAGVRDSNPALLQKVQELAPPTLPMLERIRSLSRFAQRDIRYAAIEIGIGGLRPHLATETLTHRYGDCKDKANLLAAMLAQIGVKSYLMPVNDDRGVFTEKTPPNLGFNHVILAIQLPASVPPISFPALLQNSRLGRLLIFDPTNDMVPFGQLPDYEQDSYALLVTENGGEYLHLPGSSPEMNRLVRTAKLKLLPDGSLQGEVEETWSGYYAAEKRDLKNVSLQDRKKVIEHFLGRMVTNFSVDDFELKNADDIDKDLVLRYKFTAAHYAKTAGALLLVRPHVVGEWAGNFDGTRPRHYPYEFPAPFFFTESTEITLPDGFKVDELPDPVKATAPFGEYMSRTEGAGTVLKYSRQYRMTAISVPLDGMDQLRNLFSAINVDEKQMAVLKKP
jgi:hypothetical protein